MAISPIASYFAQVGVSFDSKTFDAIEKRLDSLRQRLTQLSTATRGRRLILSAEIDKSSLASMKAQIERSIGKIVIRADLSSDSLRLSNRDRLLGLSEMRQRQRYLQEETRYLTQLRKSPVYSTSNNRAGRQRDNSALVGGLYRNAMPYVGAYLGARGVRNIYSQMNELAGTKMTAEALFMQYGQSPQRGLEEMEWLKKQSLNLGVNYQDQAGEYTGILANGMAVGMSNEAIRDLFTGISQYAVSTHSTPFEQRRVIKAITDMLGKGQVQSQELKIQLGQAMKGAEGQFAKAFDLMTYAKANNLDIFKDRDRLKDVMKSGTINSDGKALQRLLNAMTKGEVKSGEILPFFSAYLQDFSAPILEQRKGASSAILGRIQTMRSSLIEEFGGDIEGRSAGGERGFRTIFQGIFDTMESLLPLARKLGVLFDSVATSLKPMFSTLQSIARTIDSITNSMEHTKGLFAASAGILALLMSRWARIFAIIEGVSLIIEDIIFGLEGKNSFTKDILDFVKGLDSAQQSAIKLATIIGGIYLTLKMASGLARTVIPIGGGKIRGGGYAQSGGFGYGGYVGGAVGGVGSKSPVGWKNRFFGGMNRLAPAALIGGMVAPAIVESMGYDSSTPNGVMSAYSGDGISGAVTTAGDVATTIANPLTLLIKPLEDIAQGIVGGKDKDGYMNSNGMDIHLASRVAQWTAAGSRFGWLGALGGTAIGATQGATENILNAQGFAMEQAMKLSENESNYASFEKRLQEYRDSHNGKTPYEYNRDNNGLGIDFTELQNAITENKSKSEATTTTQNIYITLPEGIVQVNDMDSAKEIVNNLLNKTLAEYAYVR